MTITTQSDVQSLFVVIDRQSGKQVGQPCKTRIAASRKVDRLDNAYGAYRYYVLPIAVVRPA